MAEFTPIGMNDARTAALEMAIKALPNATPEDQCNRADIYYEWLILKWSVYIPPIPETSGKPTTGPSSIFG